MAATATDRAGALRRTPFADPDARRSAGRLGMLLLLASLAMIFAAGVLAFVIIRIQTEAWGDLPLPPLPRRLWLGTAVLAVSSATMQAALVAIRRGRPGLLLAGVAATGGLGAIFLALQTASWLAWGPAVAAVLPDDTTRLALSGFYVLTGLHAAHVVGGLVPMLVVAVQALRGAYTARDHAGVEHCTAYWHFLGVVWLGVLATLVLGT